MAALAGLVTGCDQWRVSQVPPAAVLGQPASRNPLLRLVLAAAAARLVAVTACNCLVAVARLPALLARLHPRRLRLWTLASCRWRSRYGKCAPRTCWRDTTALRSRCQPSWTTRQRWLRWSRRGSARGSGGRAVNRSLLACAPVGWWVVHGKQASNGWLAFVVFVRAARMCLHTRMHTTRLLQRPEQPSAGPPMGTPVGPAGWPIPPKVPASGAAATATARAGRAWSTGATEPALALCCAQPCVSAFVSPTRDPVLADAAAVCGTGMDCNTPMVLLLEQADQGARCAGQ